MPYPRPRTCVPRVARGWMLGALGALLLLGTGCGAQLAGAAPYGDTLRAERSGAATDEIVEATNASGHLQLHTDPATAPAELRARVGTHLERPPLARITGEGYASDPVLRSQTPVDPRFAPSGEDPRPAFRAGPYGEPFEVVGGPRSDPLSPNLITTVAEVDTDDGQYRLRYVRE